MADRNLYTVLELDRSASTEDIKRAFRKLAKKYHPDQNKGDATAEKRFKEVQAAYAVLSDPDQRRRYDTHGSVGEFNQRQPGAQTYTWTTNGPDAGFDMGDLNEVLRNFSNRSGSDSQSSSVFEELFSGGRRKKRAKRQTRTHESEQLDFEQPISLSFLDAALGTTLKISLAAAGRRGADEKVDVQIPAGISEGQRIRVRGRGLDGSDGSRGDLYILCHIEPHQYFRRDGDDIHLDLPLTLTEAALGAKVDVPTLTGMRTVTIPPGTASGKKLRLTGCGVRNARAGGQGDLYAHIRIVPPAKLSAAQRDLLVKLADTDLGSPREGLWK